MAHRRRHSSTRRAQLDGLDQNQFLLCGKAHRRCDLIIEVVPQHRWSITQVGVLGQEKP
jgi:hypothetical protein